MTAFNAPRIIGQGQIQSPTVLKENAFDVLADNIEMQRDKKEDKRRWETKLRESNQRYDKDRFDRAQDRNLLNKWRLQEHKNQQFKVWKANEPQNPDGTEKSFDEWYKEHHPDIQTQLQQQSDAQDYQTWQNAHGIKRNPYVQSANIVNPFTGLIDRWGWGEGEWAPGKFIAKGAKGLWDMTGIGKQEGSYVPGNETGDTNPAMLEDGEYVLNRNAVDKLGKGFLDYINHEAYPRFQEGGFNKRDVAGGTARIQGPEILEENAFSSIADQKKEYQKMAIEAAAKVAGAGGFQSGGFNKTGVVGSEAEIADPERLEESAFSSLADAKMEAQKTMMNMPGSDSTMDYSSLSGSGMYPSQYDALVKSRNEGWDPNWDFDEEAGWQEGGYIKPKGYRVGGSVDPYKSQDTIYKHQRDRFQRERDEDVWEFHRQRVDNQKEMDAFVDQEIANLQNDWRFTLPAPAKRTLWNPYSWFNKSEEEIYDELRRNAPKYDPEKYLRSEYGQSASQAVRDAIRSGDTWSSKGSVESDFDKIQE